MNIFSRFLVGVRDKDRFLSVCWVSTGFDKCELLHISAMLSNKKISGPHPSVVYGREQRNVNVFYDPVKAPVVQVKASEFIKSESYAVDHTLR